MQRDGERQKLFTRRALILGGGQFALLGGLVARMYQLQVEQADSFRMLAEDNRINLQLLPPPRGLILDREGVKLALNRQNYRALIVAEQARDVASTLERLDRIVELGEADRKRVLGDIGRRRAFVPVTVKEGLTWNDVARISVNAPDLPGVIIDTGPSRFYPFGESMAHVLGYVGPVSEEELGEDPLLHLPGFNIGKNGIEKTFDRAMRGSAGSSQVEVNAVGRVIRELSRDEGDPGQDITLTIDARLQEFTRQRLEGQSASAVVMDVITGEVLAMCSVPSFDPEAFSRGLSQDEWKRLITDEKAPLTNKAIAGQYSPGSTFKMVVALAALEAGIDPRQTHFCRGHIYFGDNKFHCWKRGGHGHMDMYNGIVQSCDVYFYEIAKKVGVDRIVDMARRFGFGTETGIEIPGERSGLVPTREWKQAMRGQPWVQGETLVLSIGQGYLLSTPLQLAVMAARLANGGRAVAPHIIKRVGPHGEAAVRAGLEALPALELPRGGLAMVTNAMDGVVNGERGTARGSAIGDERFMMAGKTGTAQVRRITKSERDTGVKKNSERPWRERDHALFVAYAPVDDPRYAISVVVEHGGGGSSAAAPIAKDVLTEVQRLDPAGHFRKGLVIGDQPSPAEVAVAGKPEPPR